MDKKIPVISIVGRPNVGKSSLFNRVLGKRVAVVDDMAGVTRDRNYMRTTWNDRELIIVDTGGLIPNLREAIPEAIHEQVDIAVAESTVILFVVELGTGVTDLDQMIAQRLRKTNAGKTILVVNKAESAKAIYEIDTYLQLGLGKPYPVSALHGKGIADLLDEALELAAHNLGDDYKKSLKEKIKKNIEDYENLQNESQDGSQENLQEEIYVDPTLKVAIVGRPNAGKSSLVNKLLKQNRMIVDSVAGTTRDAIDSHLTIGEREVIIIDTAGLRKKARVKKADLEYYSNLRALDSIKRCNVCVLVIDTDEKIGVQDMRILRKIFEERKGAILVWNKWDLVEKDHKTFDRLVAETHEEFPELKHLPMMSLSALTGQRVSSLMDRVFEVSDNMLRRVPAKEFEDKIFSWVRSHPHPVTPGKEVRFLGAKQVMSVPFPCFRFFVTHHDMVSPGYERFLANKIYDTYDFSGCPVVLEFRKSF